MNIFLTRDDVVKIGDFGVAKIYQNTVPSYVEEGPNKIVAAKAGRVGTPLYLSPEVIRQNPYDYKVDTWAVGCCLFHLAALDPPFQSDDLKELSKKILTETPKPLNAKYYTERLSNFIFGSLMQKDPNNRPYINNIMKRAPTYFSDDVLKWYKDEVLPHLKY